MSQEEAQHASFLCARAVPRWLLSVYVPCKSTEPASRLFHWARGRGATCDVLAAAFDIQPGFAWHARARHCARCLSRESAARELSARPHRAALIEVGSCTRQGHGTGERPLSFGARLLCDVPAAACENHPALAWHAQARHCAHCLSRAGAARVLSAHARRAALVMVASCTKQGHCTSERPLSFGARPWCDMPATTTHHQPPFARHARARHCARCHSGGSEALELSAHARRAALVVVGSCNRQ